MIPLTVQIIKCQEGHEDQAKSTNPVYAGTSRPTRSNQLMMEHPRKDSLDCYEICL